MKEILWTSSVLILVLLLLRMLFRKTISRLTQYALWGLVLLRLLVPVSLPAVQHNVLTATQPVRQTVTAQLEQPRFSVPVAREPLSQHPDAQDTSPTPQNPAAADQWVIETDTTAVRYRQLAAADVLRMIWYAGMAVMALWFLAVNLRFRRKLRRDRRPYPAADCRLPVYLVDQGLPSPCLVGLFRPAVYLTPAAAATPDALRHVLAHETTHARHLDPLWSLLRCVCLTIYWFDPLVWAAAELSRRDCELACDESALHRLGPAERIPYGKTLLQLIPVARRPENPMLAATTMTAGKRQLKERITNIAENRRTIAAALFVAIALAAVTCIATFTGGSGTARQLTQSELTAYAQTFVTPVNCTDSQGTTFQFRPSQFLTSTYGGPEKIDLYQLFYDGAASDRSISSEERQAVVKESFAGEDPGVDLAKITTGQADEILTRWTGKTLSEWIKRDSGKDAMADFCYLPDYDAYYHFHGDTNAIGALRFYAGETDGKTATLYYRAEDCGLVDTGNSGEDAWAKVTLTLLADGGFHFRSNQLCSQPDSLLESPQPLTEQELAYFNETFFNAPSTEDGFENISIANQFLSSLYDTPEDVDLFELFYLGVPDPNHPGQVCTSTPEEDALVYGTYLPDCLRYKASSGDLNAILQKYTGLTLKDTAGIGLDGFTYLPDKDAYYWAHGDTNYRGTVTFTSGIWQDELVRLYYEDTFFADGWKCVTLQKTGDTYRFVSNQPSGEVSTLHTSYPDWDPAAMLPLEDGERVTPEAVEFAQASNDCQEILCTQVLSNGDQICVYRSTDGALYAAYRSVGSEGDTTIQHFQTLPETNAQTADLAIQAQDGMLGYRTGFSLTYLSEDFAVITEYYGLDDSGHLQRIFQHEGITAAPDLDGDGSRELIWTPGSDDPDGAGPYLFFLRDGQILRANLTDLTQSVWPESDFMEWSYDGAHCYLTIHGFVDMPDWGPDAQAWYTRWVYFDGENLRFYKDERTTTDHMLEGTEGAPADVVAAAKSKALAANHTLTQAYDDWRISSLRQESAGSYADRVELWSVGYEVHLTNPADAVWAGSNSVDEKGWFGGNYGGSPYLLFLLRDGSRVLMENDLPTDVDPGSTLFQGALTSDLLENGALPLAEIPGADLAAMLYHNAIHFCSLLAQQPEEEISDAINRLAAYYDAADEEDRYLIEDPLQTLRWNTSSLTDGGTRVYQQMLAALGS